MGAHLRAQRGPALQKYWKASLAWTVVIGVACTTPAAAEPAQRLHDGPVPAYGGWALLGLIGLLALFRLVRGRIRIEQGWAGYALKRFTAGERLAHWLLALSFLALALSGLTTIYGGRVLAPLAGEQALAGIAAYARAVHTFAMLPFVIGLVLTFDMQVGHNLPTLTDLKWLLRGGGIFSRSARPPAWKFNAAQKAFFWIVVLGGIVLTITGLALCLQLPVVGWITPLLKLAGLPVPAGLGLAQELNHAAAWHLAAGLLVTMAVVAHIFVRGVASDGALDAMTLGEVDLNWARERHGLWADAEIRKLEARRRRSLSTGANPAE